MTIPSSHLSFLLRCLFMPFVLFGPSMMECHTSVGKKKKPPLDSLYCRCADAEQNGRGVPSNER